MEAKQLREVLLLSSKSTSPYSTSVIDPSNGNALWSYKGNELNGVGAGLVEPVGVKGDYFAVMPVGRPFIHFVTTKKAAITTSLAGKPESIQINKTGRFAFVLVNSKVYCYDIKTGELLKLSANSCLNATKMRLCPNDLYLAFPMNDGNLLVYTMDSLTIRSSRSEEEVAPFCSFLSHSKGITDVAFSCFDSMFMLSVGLDHRLVLYDLNSKTVLQKIHFDTELTSCAFSLSDTFLFCGTKTGRLVKLSLFHAQAYDSTDIIQTQSATDAETHTVFDKHEGKAICKIVMNLDGTRLATGDVSGKVMVWDPRSGQILVRISKNEEIHSLMFAPFWESLSNPDYEPDSLAIQKFQHEIAEHLNPVIKTSNCVHAEQKLKFKEFDQPVDEVLNKKEKHVENQAAEGQPTEEGDAESAQRLELINEIKKFKAEVDRLRSENDSIAELISAEEAEK
ncbi:hypothetical protein M3Y97_00561400 [Aphelenchoides bicaudatus]|nr:hypothetical protein M3Y97_00561400 [Aphelenchoides bicaudatus]